MRGILTPGRRATRRARAPAPMKQATVSAQLPQYVSNWDLLPQALLATAGEPRLTQRRPGGLCRAPYLPHRHREAAMARSAQPAFPRLKESFVQTTTLRAAKLPGPNSNDAASNQDPRGAGKRSAALREARKLTSIKLGAEDTQSAQSTVD
jgi:hypothetical protein